MNIRGKNIQVNGEIKDKEVMLIGSNGENLGVVPTKKALEAAAAENLDLVEVAGKAVPPVYKIMDYGKYKFEMSKKEKESKKNQKVVEVKEVRLSINIDTHDFNTKVAHVQRFVKSGNKVKVSIRFRGREMGHSEIGFDIMKKFEEACSEFAVVERPAKLEGRSMLMFLAPRSKAK